MAIAVVCPQCAARIKAPDSAAGKRAKCPKCQTKVEIPAPSLPTVQRPPPPNPPKLLPSEIILDTGEEDQEQYRATFPQPAQRTHRTHITTAYAPAVAPQPPPPVPTIIMMQAPAAAPVIVQQTVVVHNSRAHSNSLGKLSILFGVLAVGFCWMPLIGVLAFPLASLGILFAVAGFLIALFRGGAGVAYPIAGGLLCAFAFTVQSAVTAAIVAPLNDARQKAAALKPK